MTVLEAIQMVSGLVILKNKCGMKFGTFLSGLSKLQLSHPCFTVYNIETNQEYEHK
jgi:hypothetical protein